jgi:hypothetical protein
MSKQQPRKPADPKLSDLRKQAPSTEEAGLVKGGGMRRGGDDDLKDLEVER